MRSQTRSSAVLITLLSKPLDVVGDLGSNAIAIIRRAPLRATSSSVIVDDARDQHPQPDGRNVRIHAPILGQGLLDG
jgi:hypothetical protein